MFRLLKEDNAENVWCILSYTTILYKLCNIDCFKLKQKFAFTLIYVISCLPFSIVLPPVALHAD